MLNITQTYFLSVIEDAIELIGQEAWSTVWEHFLIHSWMIHSSILLLFTSSAVDYNVKK